MAGDRYLITDQHQTYFITCTVIKWVDIFTRDEYKKVIVDALNYCIKEKGLVINGWTLMTNHLHFIGYCNPPFRMSDFLRDFKKFTSKKIILTIKEIPESRRDWLLDKFSFEAKRTRRAENFKVWTDDNHAVEILHINSRQKLDYIHNNPVRAEIVQLPEEYLYSSARDYYLGVKGLVDIELMG